VPGDDGVGDAADLRIAGLGPLAEHRECLVDGHAALAHDDADRDAYLSALLQRSFQASGLLNGLFEPERGIDPVFGGSSPVTGSTLTVLLAGPGIFALDPPISGGVSSIRGAVVPVVARPPSVDVGLRCVAEVADHVLFMSLLREDITVLGGMIAALRQQVTLVSADVASGAGGGTGENAPLPLDGVPVPLGGCAVAPACELVNVF
jgi:hypothetical protein